MFPPNGLLFYHTVKVKSTNLTILTVLNAHNPINYLLSFSELYIIIIQILKKEVVMERINTLISEKGVIYLISQIVSIIATLFLLFSYQMKKHRSIVLMQSMASLLFGLQYLMIGLYGGALCNFVGMIRSYTYSYRTKSKYVDHIMCPIIFSIAFAAVGYFTYETVMSLLPICAMIISSFVTWNPRTQQLRALTLPTSAMWLVYNFVGGSVVAVGAEIMSEISIVIGLIRFRKKKQSVTSC